MRRAGWLDLITVVLVTTGLLVVGQTPAAAASDEPVRTPSVVVNEIAAASALSSADSFFELRNISAEPVDLTGWAAYRCDERGLRVNLGRPEASLTGVVLAPGEIFTAAHMSARRAADAADARFSGAYSPRGFGLVLVDAEGRTVDSVAVYPNEPWATQSECGAPPNLPVALAGVLDESWQRTERGAWVRAESTPGEQNATASSAGSDESEVRIDEIAAAGPAGSGDDVVELHNAGASQVDLSGWRLYRCTAAGEVGPDTLQVAFPTGTTLAQDGRLVIGGPDFASDGVEPDFRTTTSLADATSGALLVDADGRRVDGVTLSAHLDTGCQTGDQKLDSGLDHRAGHSWQRDADGGFAVAIRTPGAEATRPAGATRAAVRDRAAVSISEFAADPVIDGETVVRSHFVEIANYSGRRQPIGGWSLTACGLDGFPERDALAWVPDGTMLETGQTWVAALAGTDAAVTADAVFDAPLDFRGAGVALEDSSGQRVDSVGAYHVNEMDRSVDTPSTCSDGLTLTVFAVDRLRGESYQRAQRTGDNSADFVPATATPGGLAVRDAVDPAELVADAVQRLRPEASASATAPSATASSATASSATATSPSAAIGEPATILAAVAGAADGVLSTRVGDGERTISPSEVADLESGDTGYRFPYARFSLAADGAQRVQWRGSIEGAAALRLSVWDAAANAWRSIDEAVPSGVSPASVSLAGSIRAAEVVDGAVDVLVQSVPRSEERLHADEALADPEDYDFAISHLTDTQYLSEAYPEVYADVIGWVAANADSREIAFASHTGDLIQNWVDPDQPEERARREFEVASAMQAALDRAGVPNSVLPGNHDAKRGVSADLFNEFFGPDRYAEQPWYGGSIAPGDNTANFSTFTVGGARMLMLSLPYAYGERELVWAEQIVAQHPDHNVVVSTHEHVTPKTSENVANRSNSSRWLSRADQLWNRVVAPNRNVVMVLSGHFHGLGRIVTENAGGIEGHTVVEALADYQEFRTHTGERATGFSRLLQFDVGGGRVAVDAHSSTLDAATSAPYDYEQFVRDDGHAATPSNDRPWRVLADGLQDRYGFDDDHFVVDLELQYTKGFTTSGLYLAQVG